MANRGRGSRDEMDVNSLNLNKYEIVTDGPGDDLIIRHIDTGDEIHFGKNGEVGTGTNPNTVNGVRAFGETLDKDGTDDATNLETLIEDLDADGGEEAICYGGTITLDSFVAPSTTGNRVILRFANNPTIDITGVTPSTGTPVIDLSSASNVSLRGEFTVAGENESAKMFAIRPGDGFRCDEVTFDGGMGGFELKRVSDVQIGPLNATNLHKTDDGGGAAIAVGGCESVYIRFGDISDVDRASEIDDVSDGTVTDVDTVTVEGGTVTNVNGAGTSLFTLDAHNHDPGGEISNVVYRNIRVVDCQSFAPLSAIDRGAGVDVTFENIQIIDSEPIELRASDAKLKNCKASNPNYTSPNKNINVRGGEATIERFNVGAGLNNMVEFSTAGNTVTHGTHVIRDIAIPDGFTRFLVDYDGVGMDHLRVENCYCEADIQFEGMNFAAGAFSGNRYGLRLEDVELNMNDGSADDAVLVDSNDPPARIIGGYINGTITVPSGSVQTDVRT